MKVYFDTGLLLKLYCAETNSMQATALIQSHPLPICFCPLQQSELRNALYRKTARTEISRAELGRSLKRIQSDLTDGVLQVPDVPWQEVWMGADRLTAKFALVTPCRTLGVLHVAVALQLGLKIFGTTDSRQTVLARKAGLKVISLT